MIRIIIMMMNIFIVNINYLQPIYKMWFTIEMFCVKLQTSYCDFLETMGSRAT